MPEATKYLGKYRGTVVNNVDPMQQGRIQAMVPDVLGDTPCTWAMPCLPLAGPQTGVYVVPVVGAGVWIEFEGGDVSFPIWTGCYWRDGERPQDGAPAVKAIITRSSHKILLDDDGETITVTDQNQNQITLDSDGVTLERGGNKVVVSDAEVNVNDGALEVS